MDWQNERGQSLIEVIVSVGVVAIVLAATATAVIAATHRAGPDPIQTALQQSVEREMRIAVDLLKYTGGTIAPATVATSLPLPGGTAFAAHLSVVASPMPGGGATVTTSASSDGDASKHATLTDEIPQPAPLPSSNLAAPQSAPAPTGAP